MSFLRRPRFLSPLGFYLILFLGALTSLVFFAPGFFGMSYSNAEGGILIGGTVMIVAVLHLGVLTGAKRLTTRSGQRLGLIIQLLPFFTCVLYATYLAVTSILNGWRLHLLDDVIWPMVGLSVVLPWIAGLRTFSIPCSAISALPLFLHYAIFALIISALAVNGSGGGALMYLFLILPLVGYHFPGYRRLVQFWRPTPLPRLKRSRRAVTLIELLIAVAILALFVVGLSNGVGAVSRLTERHEDWRLAVELAENQIALLRAGDALPEIGSHEIDSRLAELYPFDHESSIEVREGPIEGLREVRVRVRVVPESSGREVELAVLLPKEAPESDRP